MDLRRHTRYAIDDMTVAISDSNRFNHGKVKNISRFGMAVSALSKSFDSTVSKYTVVVSTDRKNLQLSAYPRWATEDNFSQSVGMELSNVPWEWIRYVIKFENGPTSPRLF